MGSNLVELVLFAELHALLPAVVALEEIGCDPSKLDQLVLFQALGQGDVVKVVIGIDGGAQGLVEREAHPESVKRLHLLRAVATTRAAYLTAKSSSVMKRLLRASFTDLLL